MSAAEYYHSTPGPEQVQFQSTDSFWKGGQPAPSNNTQSPPLHIPPPKSSNEDYISPQDPTFSLTNFPSNYNSSTSSQTKPVPAPPPENAIPIPPPKVQQTVHVQSPPAPHSPDSAVTDESDESLVHVRRPSGGTNVSNHRSDSLSLTHSNLQHHNGLGSGMTSPGRDYRLFSNHERLRYKELGTHSKDTLNRMLIRQEERSDKIHKMFRDALDKLEQYKLDLLEANNHCRRLERACQKLTDERMLMHTQATEAVAKAQQQTLTAQQELSICKLRLEHTEQALDTAKVDFREAKLQHELARAEAERSRNEAHRIREETNVREAREHGRKQGFEEGVSQGRVIGISQSGSPGPRQITQPGEPSNASIFNTIIANTNVTNPGANDTSIVGDVSTSPRADRSPSGSSRGTRVSRADFEDAVERARRETEARLQHELELKLSHERERLRDLGLRHEQQREQEMREERERLKQSLEERERQRVAQLQAELDRLRSQQTQTQEEMIAERVRLRELEIEKGRERELRENEQRERERERQDRENERSREAEQHERERRRLERERDRERQAAAARDRERDRAVAEATAQAAAAAAAANAANATRPGSEASGSGSENEPSSLRSYLRTSNSPIPPQPYIMMPRPPVDMPVPMVPQPPVTIPASVSMPEPNVNPRPHARSVTLPATVPARRTRDRRASMDSQSSISTVAGAFESLVSFPHAVPGRVSSSGSTRAVPGVAGSSGSNGRPPSASTSRNGAYTRPHMSTGTATGPYSNHPTRDGLDDGLSDIPEDVSVGMPSPQSSLNNHPGGRGYGSAAVVPPPPVLHGAAPVIPPLPVLHGSAPSSSQHGRKPEQPPSWFTNPPPDATQSPGVPTIQIDGGSWGSAGSSGHEQRGRHASAGSQPMNMNLLNPQYHPGGSSNLRRSDSSNSVRPSLTSVSSYEFTVEPPSNPTSPTTGRPGGSHEQPPPQNQFLSPHHTPVLSQPVLPRRPQSPVLPVRINEGGSGRRRSGTVSASAGEREREVPTVPNSPSMPAMDAQSLPPGFIPQVFTPHGAAAPTLPSIGGGVPDVGAGLPPGFVPQAITDSVTGVVTPLTGMTALPGVGGPAAGGTTSGATSRRQSAYGNPNANEDEGGASGWKDGGWGNAGAGGWGNAGDGGGWGNAGAKPAGGTFSPYMSSSSPVPTGPPVIPNITWGDADDAGPSGGRSTPGQRPRSLYGNVTPGGSTRNLSGGGTPSGGGVYQNPLRQEEGENEDGEGETDDLVARNTRINATAPPIAVKEKKKKKGRR